jgi:hypothetical protein
MQKESRAKKQEPREERREKREEIMPKTPSSKFQIPGSNGKQKKIKKHSCISGYLKNQESRNKRR